MHTCTPCEILTPYFMPKLNAKSKDVTQSRFHSRLLETNYYSRQSEDEVTLCNQLLESQQSPKSPSKSSLVVTVCLSSCEDCNGRYEDTTSHFKIQCKCECHSAGEKSKPKSAFNLRHQTEVNPESREETEVKNYTSECKYGRLLAGTVQEQEAI
ncbi:hypothetical protein BH18THE2_BH18THE2_22720 [soil metagenome]